MSIYLLWGMLALLGFVFVIIFLYTICCMFKYIRKKEKRDDHIFVLFEKNIGCLVTISIALIANLFSLNSYNHQKDQDAHSRLIEKLTYSYVQPSKDAIRNIQNNLERADLQIPIKIDVRTGEVYKFSIIEFSNNRIEDIDPVNAATIRTEEYEDPERVLTLKLNKENEHFEDVTLTYYILLEGMDGTRSLDRLQFTVNRFLEVTEWNPTYYTSVIGFNYFSEGLKEEYKEYRELYEILKEENIL